MFDRVGWGVLHVCIYALGLHIDANMLCGTGIYIYVCAKNEISV